jgi:uncharacterized membrane protein YvbJ
MVHCANCGAELSEEARFCSACGKSILKTTSEEISVASENLIQRVKELLSEGNVTRIIIKNEEDKVLLEVPATIGVIGILIAPWLAALGAIAGLATNAKLTIIREE